MARQPTWREKLMARSRGGLIGSEGETDEETEQTNNCPGGFTRAYFGCRDFREDGSPIVSPGYEGVPSREHDDSNRSESR